jgi:tetratricopeptide (TPR) repeat protein
MESMSRPMRRLQEEGSWFVRASEVRLLWVGADGASRGPLLSLVEKLEHHADNRSPFIVLDAPWSGPDGGALARAARWSGVFSEKLDALRAAGVGVGRFDPAEPPPVGLEGFARELTRACEALRPPLAGLVVVLAPPRIDAPEAFVAELRALVSAPALAAVRWVVVESDSQHTGGVVAELGPERALVVDGRADEAEQQRDLAALAGPPPAPGVALPLPHPWGPWTSGGAMPRRAPPRRIDDPLPPSDEQLRQSGLSPEYVKGGAQLMQRLMLGAALALRQQRFSDAIELQTRACELCATLGVGKEHVIQRLVLAGYLLAASAPQAARATYERAALLATEARLPEQRAQAELGLGMLDGIEQRPSAMEHYAEAARQAEAASSLALAIECWRMAGQCAHAAGLVETAVEAWQSALALADKLPPEAAQATSAPDIARALANALAARGQSKRADALHRQAFRMERGVEPGNIEREAAP